MLLIEKPHDSLSSQNSPRPDLDRTNSDHSISEAIISSEKRPGFIRQTRVLIARAHKNVFRNFAQLAGLIAQGAILGVIMGLTYYQLPEVCSQAQVCAE